MTADHAIVRGTFSDWRPVKSRSVLQLVIECPIEETEEVMKRLGVPMPGVEKWVAVALLTDKAGAPQAPEPAKPGPSAAPEPGKAAISAPKRAVDPAASERGRVAYANGTVGEQARFRAIALCKDTPFREWFLAEKYGEAPPDTSEQQCRDELCRWLKISSRREIATNDEALRKFLAIETDYKIHTGEIVR